MTHILQFKITLQHSKPVIWRRFQITDDFRMDRFHQVIQIVMGWTNSHLHDFRIGDRTIGMVDGDTLEYFPEMEDECSIFLDHLDLKKGDRFIYLYDYGDYWEHELKLEKVSEGHLSAPSCLKGQNSCPPEDCGSMSGYQEILKILKKPEHPEYKSYIQWLPRKFDPYHFPIDKVNKELAKFGNWHWRHPEDYSTPWHQLY